MRINYAFHQHDGYHTLTQNYISPEKRERSRLIPWMDPQSNAVSSEEETLLTFNWKELIWLSFHSGCCRRHYICYLRYLTACRQIPKITHFDFKDMYLFRIHTIIGRFSLKALYHFKYCRFLSYSSETIKFRTHLECIQCHSASKRQIILTCHHYN